jgi:uracil-DNA glycosylase family 4
MSPEQLKAWHHLGLGPYWQLRAPSLEQRVARSGTDAHPGVVADLPVVFRGADPADRADAWQMLAREIAGCEACALSKTRQQVVVGSGAMTARCMLIGEAPGAEEDRQGQPFVGRAGALLDQILHAAGLDRARDVYVANTLKCRPPGNRNPEPDESERCRPFLLRQLALLEPGLIVLMGRFAAQSVLATDAPISALRGRIHQARLGASEWPCVVTYHPAYLLRNPADKAKAWRDWLVVRRELIACGAISALPRQ